MLTRHSARRRSALRTLSSRPHRFLLPAPTGDGRKVRRLLYSRVRSRRAAGLPSRSRRWARMKTCPSCGEEKPLDEFSWRDKRKGRRASECKTCHSVVRRNYYIRNKAKEVRYAIARNIPIKKKVREDFQAYKTSLSCAECGENHPATLHFHHTDPLAKESDVSRLVICGLSRKRIMAEIQKCVVLCANCHAKVHWDLAR